MSEGKGKGGGAGENSGRLLACLLPGQGGHHTVRTRIPPAWEPNEWDLGSARAEQGRVKGRSEGKRRRRTKRVDGREGEEFEWGWGGGGNAGRMRNLARASSASAGDSAVFGWTPQERERSIYSLSHTHTLSLPLFPTPSASLSAGLDGMACLCLRGGGLVYYMCAR